MINRRLLGVAAAAAAALVLGLLGGCAMHGRSAGGDPLPSWNDREAKQAIFEFVAAVTDASGDAYVAPGDRIATFDNDGTLWVEKPIYTQFVFTFDRIRRLAPRHPSWRTTQPYRAAIEGDMQTLAESGAKGLLELTVAARDGATAEEFHEMVEAWAGTAEHPRFRRLYTECIYQPQLELMRYLRAHDFRVFIVSGGGIDFMRPWTDRVYGVPAPMVVGTNGVMEFAMRGDEAVLLPTTEIGLIDDGPGKPVGIGLHIGQRPIFAFGNSQGDREMLLYATQANDPGRRSIGLIVLHDDAEREYAYGPAEGLPDSKVGTFPQSLYDQAERLGWHVVRMKEDWNRIFAWE